MIGRTNSGTGGGKSKHQFYGVAWDRSSNTALSRLGDAVDFASPIAAVGSGSGSSPFDKIMPWKGMNEFNIIDGAVAYERGKDSEFSRTLYDTVVRIPKFYYKVVNGTNWELWITPEPYEGFSAHPAFYESDEIYVGKYLTGVGTVSKSGVSPYVNDTALNFRTASYNKGTGWQPIDAMALSCWWMLYLVEFADWNSQAVIGNGHVDGNSSVQCGGTDSINYHTGRGTDTNSQIKYRGIEDIWGNVWQNYEGVNVNKNTPYYCTDRSKYAYSTTTGYTQYASNLPNSSGALIKTIGYDSNAPWLFIPTGTGATNSTYVTDVVWSGNNSVNGLVALCGSGCDNEGANAGMFATVMTNSTAVKNNNTGSRLMFIPR